MFIRYIAGPKKNPPLLYAGIVEVAKKIKNGTAILVTSSFTRTELMETRMRPNDFAVYDGLLNTHPRKAVVQGYDDPVARLGSAVQAELEKHGKKLSLPDLIHLATAIYTEADELHTTDGPLLSCDGEPVLKKLRILTPQTEQSVLF